MWKAYAGETRVILGAFLSAVKPADQAERAVLEKLMALASEGLEIPMEPPR